MTAFATRSERQTVERLVDALKHVRCVDSVLYLDVSRTTFDSFAGTARHVFGDDDTIDFDSKCVLDLARRDGAPGGCVTVELWAPPPRKPRRAV